MAGVLKKQDVIVVWWRTAHGGTLGLSKPTAPDPALLFGVITLANLNTQT